MLTFFDVPFYPSSEEIHFPLMCDRGLIKSGQSRENKKYSSSANQMVHFAGIITLLFKFFAK
jgi:hypothetical protein